MYDAYVATRSHVRVHMYRITIRDGPVGLALKQTKNFLPVI